MIGTTAEIDAMLKDAGVPVIFGAQSTYGVLNAPEELGLNEMGHSVVTRESKLIIRAGSLVNVKQDMAITISGVAYEVRIQPRLMDDGQLAELAVVKV